MEIHLESFKKKLEDGVEVQITIVDVNKEYYAAKVIDVDLITDENKYGIYVTDENGNKLKYKDNLRLKGDIYPAYGISRLKSEL